MRQAPRTRYPVSSISTNGSSCNSQIATKAAVTQHLRCGNPKSPCSNALYWVITYISGGSFFLNIPCLVCQTCTRVFSCCSMSCQAAKSMSSNLWKWRRSPIKSGESAVTYCLNQSQVLSHWLSTSQAKGPWYLSCFHFTLFFGACRARSRLRRSSKCL